MLYYHQGSASNALFYIEQELGNALTALKDLGLPMYLKGLPIKYAHIRLTHAFKSIHGALIIIYLSTCMEAFKYI